MHGVLLCVQFGMCVVCVKTSAHKILHLRAVWHVRGVCKICAQKKLPVSVLQCDGTVLLYIMRALQKTRTLGWRLAFLY